MSELLNINVGANALQVALQASGIVGQDGKLKNRVHLEGGGVALEVPASIFPFLTDSQPVLAVITLVQINQPDQLVKPTLII
jgi:hypothetical protein